MTLRVEVMLVCLDRFPSAFPAHVLDQLTQPAINLRLRLSTGVYAPNSLCDIPMACLMDIGLESRGPASWIPAALAKCFRTQLRSTATKEDRNVTEVRFTLGTSEVIIQHVMVSIELTAFHVEIAP